MTKLSKMKLTRLTLGISKEELAVAAGCSVVYIERLENGRQRNPGVKIALPIAAMLGLEIADLWPIEEETARKMPAHPA